MGSSGDRLPAGAVVFSAIAAFLVVFYLWSAVIAATEDSPPAGETCVVPRGYIVMDDQDLVTGSESVRWFPVPVTVCTGEGFTRERWSIYYLVGLPLALGVAGAVGWAVWRSNEPPEEWEPVDT